VKILLVDDDDGVRDALHAMLRYKGHVVDEAVSAEEALLKFPGAYDLVISDIHLEKMDGISLLDRLRESDPRVPVIMITGFGSPEIEETCRQKGAKGFLNKPFNVKTLLDLVAQQERTVG
jgi:CheY-like chemotaxis protein